MNVQEFSIYTMWIKGTKNNYTKPEMKLLRSLCSSGIRTFPCYTSISLRPEESTSCKHRTFHKHTIQQNNGQSPAKIKKTRKKQLSLRHNTTYRASSFSTILDKVGCLSGHVAIRGLRWRRGNRGFIRPGKSSRCRHTS